MGKQIQQVDVDLYAACSTGDFAKVAELLKAGANAKYEDGTYGYTPLHIAAEGGHIECVRRILETIGPDGRDEHGQTPLMLASYNGHEDVARALLEAGAEPRLMNKDGATAINVAANEDFDELAELLQEKAEVLRKEERMKYVAEQEAEAKAAAERNELKPLTNGDSGSDVNGEVSLDPLQEEEDQSEELLPSDVTPKPASSNLVVYSALAAALAPPTEGGGGDTGLEVQLEQLAVSLKIELSPDRMKLLDQLGVELARVVTQIQGLGADEERKYVLAKAAKAATEAAL